MSSMTSLLCLLVFVDVILSGASSAQAKIIGGTESDESRWPFFATLFYNLQVNNVPLCGAVIWDKDTLLTAAHCVKQDPNDPELFEVYMGYKSWTEPRDLQYMFNVREIIRHPDHQSIHKRNDIALIFLDRSIDFNGINRKVQSVNDPEPLDYLDTSKCVTMGWGRDNTNKIPTKLMEVVLSILDNRICKKHCYYFNPNHHLCAGYVLPTLPAGTSNGDSGGPLVCPQKANPDKYSLVGIASFGQPPETYGRYPSYFTSVERFEDWIASVHSKTQCNVQTPAEMTYWADFKKRWFGSLFSYNDLAK